MTFRRIHPETGELIARQQLRIRELEAEVERLRRTLTEYANPDNWGTYITDDGEPIGPLWSGPGWENPEDVPCLSEKEEEE